MDNSKEDMKDERVPPCLHWSVDQVAEWIEEIGYPYYKVNFKFQIVLLVLLEEFLTVLGR